MAYTSSKFEMGIDPSRVESAANGEWSRKDFFEKLNEEYSGWVNHNNSVHEFNAQAITWAMAFAICGVILFSGGVLVGALQVRGQGLSYAMLIGELAVSLVLGLLVFYSDSIFERLEP
ncbi:hypothetical protein C5C07_15340 [Haloferax sp. Atlit-4N]|nr:hypothetical protein C5C07_15340 [Haloferax sp. Atlit-4N]